jgi:hypothetical protein
MSSPTWEIDGVRSSITVRAKSTLHDSKSSGPVRGRVTGDPKALDTTAGGTVEIPIDKFDFGNALQNAAIRSKLDAGKWPVARFHVTGAKVLSTAPWRVTLLGKLDYRDRTTAMEVEATGRISETDLEARAEFPLNLPSIGVKPPSMLFLKVADDVMVSMVVVARRVP